MQKSIALALVIGALIISVALVYHGHQLLQLSTQLQTTQKQMATLDTNLQSFAAQLPNLIGEAGKNAGRQAVHGMAEEAVKMPLNWLRSTLPKATTAGLRRFLPAAAPAAAATNRDDFGPGTTARSPVAADAGSNGKGELMIQFNLPQPVVNIHILSNLKELPAWPSFSRDSHETPGTPTNHAQGQRNKPTPPAAPQPE
jgi:cell division protein FtsL